MIIDRLLRAFQLTTDLVKHLQDVHLLLHLKDLPSNRIGDQLWCIIGARESYLKAIDHQGWQGFSCGLNDATSKELILISLNQTFEKTETLKSKELNEIQLGYALDLLEHEIQHHGQLIRYVYGNQLSFPDSWHQRYTV